MPSVADVLRRYGPDYLRQFAATMPAEQRRVLHAVMACRSGALGTIHYQCLGCGRTHVMGRSCGNRHCPSCQSDKAQAWLQRELARLLPCPYFLITFTVPETFRRFARSHPREAYSAMFRASSAALKVLAADPRHLGAEKPGYFGVLHTWGRDLNYHPHLHYVVPGGGLSADGQRWLSSRPNFFVPVRALSILYRAKLRAALDEAGLLRQVDPAVWNEAWVVHSQAVGDGRQALKYLAPYVFRVAISDRRIVSCEGGQVTFLVRKSGSRRWRTMTVAANEFLRRFLQHVLPRGLQKVRHYGFLSPNSGASFESLAWLVAVDMNQPYVMLCTTVLVTPPAPASRCPQCGQALLLIAFLPPYNDSG